jgi:hypothetical protein
VRAAAVAVARVTPEEIAAALFPEDPRYVYGPGHRIVGRMIDAQADREREALLVRVAAAIRGAVAAAVAAEREACAEVATRAFRARMARWRASVQGAAHPDTERHVEAALATEEIETAIRARGDHNG